MILPVRLHFWVFMAALTLLATVSELPFNRSALAVGPDLIVGDIFSCQQLGRVGPLGSGTIAMSCASMACNSGDTLVNWFPLPATNHPLIAINLYRLKTVAGSKRFEQIGQSWVKHGFAAANEDECGFGCAPLPGFTQLGPGCSDSYSASQFAPCSLGSRSIVNPFTGVMLAGSNVGGGGGCSQNFPSTDHRGHSHTPISHRVQVPEVDVIPFLNSGAQYYSEVHYLTSDEFFNASGNQFNNTAFRRLQVGASGENYTFGVAGATISEAMALEAWTESSRVAIEPEPQQDGRAHLAYRATDLGGGIWHYEYAIYNMNLNRAIWSFTVPVPAGVTVSNIGFHAPMNHAPEPQAENYGNAPWIATRIPTELTWSSESYSANPMANAIRWGTLYNFRFDADAPPQVAIGRVGFFKTGGAGDVLLDAPAPPPFLDCNQNTIPDHCDLNCLFFGCNVPGCGQSANCDANLTPDECQADCSGNGLPDACETDCNSNGVADSCDILTGPPALQDCNANGIPDECDLAAGVDEDCANDGIPDGCEPDCNENGRADSCDLQSATSFDCDGNATPDECQPFIDCNENGVRDSCEVYSGSSPDNNSNEIPDECETIIPVTRFVDDDAVNDPGWGNTAVSDPLEDGSSEHPFDSIQEAIDASAWGETVIVRRGVYTGAGNREISYNGRQLTVRCENTVPDDCAIDLEGAGMSAVLFANGEVDARMEHFTFRGSPLGLGNPPLIYIGESEPVIDGCRFQGPTNGFPTTVAISRQSSMLPNARVRNCSFHGSFYIAIHASGPITINRCVVEGDGIAYPAPALSLSSAASVTDVRVTDAYRGCIVYDAKPTFANCVFHDNHLAIRAINSAAPTFVGCTIVGNGIQAEHSASVRIVNSVLRDVDLTDNSIFPLDISYSNIHGGWPGVGNIDVDPVFVNPAASDFRLGPASPCIDSGRMSVAGFTWPATDMDGGPRLHDHPQAPNAGQGTPPPDMGAHEYSDCNENFMDDAIDLAQASESDCDANGMPDACDIADSVLADCNANLIPDFCEGALPVGADAEPDPVGKSRFISFVPQNAGRLTALRVTLNELHRVLPPYSGGMAADFSAFEGAIRWVGQPQTYLESTSGATVFTAAVLQCTPYYHEWGTVGLLHVYGSEIVPSSTYEVRAIAEGCAETMENAYSASRTVFTSRWADVEAPYNPPSLTVQPDLADVSALVNKFRSAPGAPNKARALLAGEDQFGLMDLGSDFSFIHIAACVDAFRGRPYPHTIHACP